MRATRKIATERTKYCALCVTEASSFGGTPAERATCEQHLANLERSFCIPSKSRDKHRHSFAILLPLLAEFCRERSFLTPGTDDHQWSETGEEHSCPRSVNQ